MGYIIIPDQSTEEFNKKWKASIVYPFTPMIELTPEQTKKLWYRAEACARLKRIKRTRS